MLLDSPRANAVLQTESLDQHAAWSTPSPLGEARLVYRGLSDVPPPQNDLMLPRVFCEKKLERGVIVLQGVPSEPWSPQNLRALVKYLAALFCLPSRRRLSSSKWLPSRCPTDAHEWVLGSPSCSWLWERCDILIYTDVPARGQRARARFSQMRNEIPHGAMFMGTCIKKVMILQVFVLLQVPPPSPMLTYATLLRQYSCAIVYRDLWHRQRSATFYRSSQDGYHNTWLMLTV